MDGCKILVVEDDDVVRQTCCSFLQEYETMAFDNAPDALSCLQADGPFAVVLSDYIMPEMDGLEFLVAIREAAPDTVRILMTGHGDLSVAVDAINQGSIFRFLEKPCTMESLCRAVADGVAQYRLVVAEHELLGKTLRGSIRVLMDILSATNPAAFSHTRKLHQLARRLAVRVGATDLWEVEVAAMLSQVGCVTVPAEILEKERRGKPLSPRERASLARHPEIGRSLLAQIPRLEGVAEAIAYQLKQFDGAGPPQNDVAGEQIPLTGRILKVAGDFAIHSAAGKSDAECLAIMNRSAEAYDPALLGALQAEVMSTNGQWEIRSLRIREISPGMVLAEDIHDGNGVVVAESGRSVTEVLRLRLVSLVDFQAIKEPILVHIRS